MTKLYKKIPKVVEESIEVGIICDHCEEPVTEDLYFAVTTHHRLWGIDSAESYVYEEFCSLTCTQQHMQSHFSDVRETMQYEIEVSKTPRPKGEGGEIQ